MWEGALWSEPVPWGASLALLPLLAPSLAALSLPALLSLVAAAASPLLLALLPAATVVSVLMAGVSTVSG